MATWLQQEKNRKREEERGDWLTFPAHAVVVDLEAVSPMASGACDGCVEPPGGRRRFHPMGTGNRVERRCPAGSPERHLRRILTNRKCETKTEEETTAETHLPVSSNLDGLVFVPGVGQVSRLRERKLPSAKTNQMYVRWPTGGVWEDTPAYKNR